MCMRSHACVYGCIYVCFYGSMQINMCVRACAFMYTANCDHSSYLCVCEVGTVGKISDCQPEGPGFNPRPGRGLNFGRPSFATPSVDRDVKPLV